ncbi:MAG: CocE/NonD family hydrolase [Eggerthellaceae bacterium]|nr:CocE/NonD family hydrolase [Eggerthellaceae bacterium]
MFNEKTIFTKARPFKDGNTIISRPGREDLIIPKGYQVDKIYKPTGQDMILEKNLAIPMRDGTIIYTDIYRPVTDEKVPVIISWSPYGKSDGNFLPYRMMRQFVGVDVSSLSGLMKWEAVDPDLWCAHGYAVCHPDSRGAYHSEGNICVFNEQEGQDGADLVEWLADQDWCSGRVGLAGNSWLAVAQWYIAAQKPPHLAAIAPWEGFCDVYRDIIRYGGIADTDFLGTVCNVLAGENYIENVGKAADAYPLFDDYWDWKAAKVENIDIPVYAVASYTSTVHTVGTFRAWDMLTTDKKWLRIHNSQEWPDFYAPEHQRDLMKFFDRYLKDEDNGWEETPTVRYSILDMTRHDDTDVPTACFPPAETEDVTYYLNAENKGLSDYPTEEEHACLYTSTDNASSIKFVREFSTETSFVGYPMVKLWVQAPENDDMDLFVLLTKLDRRGRKMTELDVPHAAPPIDFITTVGGSVLKYHGSEGRLRVSLRHIDRDKSTKGHPWFPYDDPEKISTAEIIPVEIPLMPIGLKFRPGEKMLLEIAGHTMLPAQMIHIRGIKTINKGHNIVYTGGKYDSKLVLQELPHDTV